MGVHDLSFEMPSSASWPFKAAVSVFFTLCASTINSALQALRPSFSRATPT